MKRHEAEKITEALGHLTRVVSGLVDGNEHVEPPKRPAPVNGNGAKAIPGTADELEVLYQQFKHRLLDDLRIDPVFLELLAVRPTIDIRIEPQRIAVDGGTLRGRVALLIRDGYFKATRAVGTVRRELARTGRDPGGSGTLGSLLQEFKDQGFLTSDSVGYVVAPGVLIEGNTIQRS